MRKRKGKTMDDRLQYNEPKVRAFSLTVGSPCAFPASASLFSRPKSRGRFCCIHSTLSLSHLSGDLSLVVDKDQQLYDKGLGLISVLNSVLGECTLMG